MKMTKTDAFLDITDREFNVFMAVILTSSVALIVGIGGLFYRGLFA
jgi:hypothetical protein